MNQQNFHFSFPFHLIFSLQQFLLFICKLFIFFLFFCFHLFCFILKQQTNDSILSDINECSEGTDDCNRKTQLCLNTRGGYKCQEKIGDKCLPGLKYNSETKLCEGGCFLIHFLSWLDVPQLIFRLFISPEHKSISLNYFSRFPLHQISTSVNWILIHATTATSVSTR